MLYVNGDSWTWHENLNNPDLWSNIVSKHLGMTCQNESIGCGSNARIVDNLQNVFIEKRLPELIIIALTAHHRYHIPAGMFGSWSIGPLVALYDRTGETNNSVRDFIFKHCHNEIDSVFRYYRDIWLIDLLCRQHNCRYLAFQMWDTSIEDYALMNSTQNIVNFVGKYFEPSNYYYTRYVEAFEKLRSYRSKWNYEESAVKKQLDPSKDIDRTGHPNSNGHEKIAKHVVSLLERY